MTTRIRIGLLGCGTVGSAVARAIGQDPRLRQRYEIARVSVRNVSLPRACRLPVAAVTSSALAVAKAPDIDVVVEVMGGIEPARHCIQTALARGRPVVTANKELLADHGDDLLGQAAGHGVPLRFEAAVAGAVPIVRTLTHLARSETIERLDAVLNATTTFVLSRMGERGLDIEQAVAEAQAHGYAEADPTRDLDGRDAAAKLTVLARLLWGTSLHPSEVYRMGVDRLTPDDVTAARRAGEIWQVVASATPDCARVELVGLPLAHPLARLSGATSAVQVHTRRAGMLTFTGPGAGGDATAASILADLDDVTSARIHRHRRRNRRRR